MRRLVVVAAPALGLAATAVASAACEDAPSDRLERWRPKWKPRLEDSAASWHIGRVAHPAVVAFGGDLLEGAPPRARVLVPLCGAAHDVAHFAWQGHDVVAVEGVPAALEAFKAEYAQPPSERTLADRVADWWAGRRARADAGELDPKAKAATRVVRLRAERGGARARVTWLEADFLELPPGAAATANATVDAAFGPRRLVAVEPADRARYAATLARLVKPGGRVLLVATEHPPFAGGRLGPPFSVEAAEVERIFAGAFEIAPLKREDRLPVEPVWVERGCSYFFEATYLLTRRAPTVATSPPEGGDEALDEVDPRCLGTIMSS